MTNVFSINRNASTSPLLKLPGELRDKIFRLVLANQFIHVKWTRRGGCDDIPNCGFGLRYTKCVATVSENKAYKEFSSGYNKVPPINSPKYYTSTCEERHEKRRLWEKREQKTLDLSMLGAGRQMYEEAKLLLWSTTTFSLEDPVSFNEFVRKLTFLQKRVDENAHQHRLDYLSI